MPDAPIGRRAPRRRRRRPRVRVHAAAANADLLRACAARGVARRVPHVRRATARPATTVDAPKRELVALADELDMLLAGPNGQGVVSTPVGLCAQIVAPYPPRGAIAIASQSGNFVSSLPELRRASGVGVSRAVSAGNAAAVTVPDYLEYFADRPGDARSRSRTSRGSPMGATSSTASARSRARSRSSSSRAAPRPAVSGPRRRTPARSRRDDRVFDGMCRQANVTRAFTVEEAFDAAATFATQPLPRGPRVAVVTTAGGWGVVTADAIARSELELLALPGRPARRRSTNGFRPAGAATTRSTSRAARRVTRFPRCSRS